jgi:hypothetical protein
MTTTVIEVGATKNMTATGDVFTVNGSFMGFYVNSTSGGTIVLRQGGSGGTVLGGTISPNAGYHAYPSGISGGLHVTISGTIDLTFFYRAGV